MEAIGFKNETLRRAARLACRFNGGEREPEYEEVECPECWGEGIFYLSLSRGKYMEEKEYLSLSPCEKEDVELDVCERCRGEGTIEKEI
jgi:DnaJ-class molecular chaperone